MKDKKRDVILFLVMFFISILVTVYAVYLFFTCFKDGEEVYFNYNEDYKLNYKVNIEDSEFYDNSALGEDYKYVASAIKDIDADFSYILKSSTPVKGRTYYTITAEIIAYQKYDDNKQKVWNYKDTIRDINGVNYEEDTTQVNDFDEFKIDFQKYKKLMDDYQKNYRVNLDGELLVEIAINTNIENESTNKPIDLETRKLKITIPLTESIIQIKKDIPKDGEKTLIDKLDPTINYIRLVGSVVCFIGSIILSVFIAKIILKLIGYDSKYVVKLDKILTTYNAIIVNVKNADYDADNVMYVESFDELLDAQSELRIPILYQNIKTNEKCVFVLKYDNNCLVYKMESDLYK